MNSALTIRQLYGGAITISLPSDLIDASDLRQIPDAQEVFLDPKSDVNFIFEVLDRVEPEDAKEAAKFHFDSIAEDSEAVGGEIHEVIVPEMNVRSPPQTPNPILLDGSQQVAKFNKAERDDVRVFLAVYRLTEKANDVVFVMNYPLRSTDSEESLTKAKELFRKCAESLQILDFDLFA
ncbi:Mog1p/PsbP-like protein [Serendipita vermifera]|nr:Mog1p/PsbP-like protein [Serendipita vermifera]